jgi:hypothetical protein
LENINAQKFPSRFYKLSDSTSDKFSQNSKISTHFFMFSIALQNWRLLITQETASVVQWSEFLPTDLEARVRFPALPKKKVVGLERGPLSLVSTTEVLLDRKVAAPV